jgi:hypothetical protein
MPPSELCRIESRGQPGFLTQHGGNGVNQALIGLALKAFHSRLDTLS